ncbi:MAG: hypothetical protein WC901_08060 [Candidatus Margulisiibacteriota bacterium]
MKKIWLVYVWACAFLLGVTLQGCGSSGSGGGGTNHTILGTVAAEHIGSRALAGLAVTDIVAISSDNNKYLATLDAAGNFTVGIISGQPYVLGFYNKSGGSITLLGYLKQDEVNWDSLPIMSPATAQTSLETIDINTASLEATTSVVLNSLLEKMNMTSANATYYGTLDDPLAVLTNLDLNRNGEFDFQEGKNYLFQVYIRTGINGGAATGQITEMLSGYNDTYVPEPVGYSFVFCSDPGDSKTTGTSVTITVPATVSGDEVTPTTTLTGEVTTNGYGWSVFSSMLNSPEAAPTGTYEVVVESSTYIIENFKGASAVAIGATSNFIYPIFHLVTNEAGYITTAQFKWMKLEGGVAAQATADELETAVEQTSTTSAFTHPSPFISFFTSEFVMVGEIKIFDRDGSSIDVSGYNLRPADIQHIQAGYNLTSRVVVKFDLY